MSERIDDLQPGEVDAATRAAQSVAIPADLVDTGPTSTTTPSRDRSGAATRLAERYERDAAKASAADTRARAKEEQRRRRDESKAERKRSRAERRADRARATQEPDTFEEPTAPPVEVEDTEPAEEAPAAPQVSEPETTQPITPVHDDVPEPPSVPTGRSFDGRRVFATTAMVVGAIGLACSVILAIGALLVALGAGEGNIFYDPVSAVCDALAGPLKGAFNFSGVNADRREQFVAWGVGALIYLLVSVIGQTLHRSGTQR